MTNVDLYPSRTNDTVSFLDRQDPVVYSQWNDKAPLSKADYDSYKEKGFLVLDELLTPAEVQVLLDESAKLRGGEGDLDPETVFTEKSSGDVRTIFRLHAQSEVMHRLAADERLAGLARFLLDDEVYVHQSRLNYKPGFRGKEFYWHSDFETWHTEDGMPRMRALSMSVLLTDNHAYNGPLMLIPGSQNRYVTTVGETPEDNYKSSLKEQEIGVPDDSSLAKLYEEGGIEMPSAKAGSVVIFDCNTMHGSASNITPLPRSNAFFVFNALSNRLVAPFAAKSPRPEMIAARQDVTPLARSSGSLAREAA